MNDVTKRLRLAPQPTAESKYRRGDDEFKRFLLNENIELSMVDRKFLVRVFEDLRWQIAEKKRGKPRPGPMLPIYRTPTGPKQSELLKAVIDVWCILGSAAEADPSEIRERVCVATGLSWDQIRHRIQRFDEPRKSASRRLFGL